MVQREFEDNKRMGGTLGGISDGGAALAARATDAVNGEPDEASPEF